MGSAVCAVCLGVSWFSLSLLSVLCCSGGGQDSLRSFFESKQRSRRPESSRDSHQHHTTTPRVQKIRCHRPSTSPSQVARARATALRGFRAATGSMSTSGRWSATKAAAAAAEAREVTHAEPRVPKSTVLRAKVWLPSPKSGCLPRQSLVAALRRVAPRQLVRSWRRRRRLRWRRRWS